MLDVEDIEKRITKKRTIGIMPVQINGRCCNMEEIEHIAKNGIQVFEDLELKHLDQNLTKNTLAHLDYLEHLVSIQRARGCFGDGGALVTNDDDLIKKVKLLRDHGRNTSGEVVDWGFNSRLDNLQAAKIINLKLMKMI